MGKLLQIKAPAKDRAAILNEFGDASRLRKAFAPTEARYQALLTEIKSWYDASPADKEYSEKTDRYQIDIGPRANVRKIVAKAVYKRLGLAKCLAAASFTLKALGAFLTEPEIAELCPQERTGSRDVKATPLVSLPAEALPQSDKAA